MCLVNIKSSHSISHVVWPGLDLQCVLCSSLSSLSSWSQEHYRSKERNIPSDSDSVVIVRGGSKCSVKAYKFCRLQRECRRGECLNTNRREPRRRTERRKYCAKVSCDSPCVCPQDLDPVCDQDGNKVTLASKENYSDINLPSVRQQGVRSVRWCGPQHPPAMPVLPPGSSSHLRNCKSQITYRPGTVNTFHCEKENYFHFQYFTAKYNLTVWQFATVGDLRVRNRETNHPDHSPTPPSHISLFKYVFWTTSEHQHLTRNIQRSKHSNSSKVEPRNI